jgi:hypothetical protein
MSMELGEPEGESFLEWRQPYGLLPSVFDRSGRGT